ncbi:MAG TPA: hypothetical protein VMJ31_11280 [Methylocystis sp.]|nr:hypothetical protein [Methylocystis sp.]
MQSLSPLSRCAQICGLTSQEMIVGASPRPEHELLAARYSRSSTVGKATMRSAMVAAIRAALKASQTRSAAELLVALRMMLGGRRSRSGAPRRSSRRCFYECRRPVPIFGGTPGNLRGAASADILDFAERRAVLASSRALG